MKLPHESDKADPIPTEYAECAALAKWLDRHGLIYTHVPMGGLRTGRGGAILRKMGARAGMPDYLIFTPPPANVLGRHPIVGQIDGVETCRARGVALEMKRRDGDHSSAAHRRRQERVQVQLRSCGWLILVAHGGAEAIAGLKNLGYGG